MYERRIWRGCWIYLDRYYMFTYSSIILRVSSMHYLWSLVSDVSSTKVNEKEENCIEKKGHSRYNCWFRFPSIWLFFFLRRQTRRYPTSKHRMRKSYLEMMSWDDDEVFSSLFCEKRQKRLNFSRRVEAIQLLLSPFWKAIMVKYID